MQHNGEALTEKPYFHFCSFVLLIAFWKRHFSCANKAAEGREVREEELFWQGLRQFLRKRAAKGVRIGWGFFGH